MNTRSAQTRFIWIYQLELDAMNAFADGCFDCAVCLFCIFSCIRLFVSFCLWGCEGRKKIDIAWIYSSCRLATAFFLCSSAFVFVCFHMNMDIYMWHGECLPVNVATKTGQTNATIYSMTMAAPSTIVWLCMLYSICFPFELPIKWPELEIIN